MRFFSNAKTALTAVLLLGATVAIPSTAAASEPKLEGTFSDWAAYSRSDGSEKVCYVLAKPSKKVPSSVRHGDVFFMVANWKSGQAKEQPSLITGFTMKETTPPVAVVGSARTKMFVAENEAFVDGRRDEQGLVRNMRGGSVMRVSAVSTRGTSVSYDFSLKGVTAALQKASTACR